jgi:hypothetical protein
LTQAPFLLAHATVPIWWSVGDWDPAYSLWGAVALSALAWLTVRFTEPSSTVDGDEATLGIREGTVHQGVEGVPDRRRRPDPGPLRARPVARVR